MTLTEKIMARAAGRKSVQPGDNVWVNVDVLMTHDVCGPDTIGVFKREFGAHAKVWDRENLRYASPTQPATFLPYRSPRELP